MIPSILTSEIRRRVEDFLQTTFPPSNRFFHGLLDPVRKEVEHAEHLRSQGYAAWQH